MSYDVPHLSEVVASAFIGFLFKNLSFWSGHDIPILGGVRIIAFIFVDLTPELFFRDVGFISMDSF